MTRDGAQQALEAVGLKLGSVTEVENQAEVGPVVWKSTDPNTQVDQGTTINIQISKGITQRPPETSDDENNTDDGGDEPDVPQQGTATVPIVLPDNTDMAHVVVSVDGVVQYDDTHETSLGSISVPLTGTVGEHEVTISVDGSSTSQTVTFS